MQSSSGAAFSAGVAGTILATLGNREVGEDTTPSNFGRVFNLPDTSREASFCKLKTLSWSLDVGVSTSLLL